MTSQNIKLTCKCQNNHHIKYLREITILKLINVHIKKIEHDQIAK